MDNKCMNLGIDTSGKNWYKPSDDGVVRDKKVNWRPAEDTVDYITKHGDKIDAVWDYVGYHPDPEKDTVRVEYTKCFKTKEEACAAANEKVLEIMKEVAQNHPKSMVTVIEQDGVKIQPCTLPKGVGTGSVSTSEKRLISRIKNLPYLKIYEDGENVQDPLYLSFISKFFNEKRYEIRGLNDDTNITTKSFKEDNKCVPGTINVQELTTDFVTITEEVPTGKVTYKEEMVEEDQSYVEETIVKELVPKTHHLDVVFEKIYVIDLPQENNHHLRNLTFEVPSDINLTMIDQMKIAFKDSKNLWYVMDKDYNYVQVKGDGGKLFHEMKYTKDTINFNDLNYWKHLKPKEGEKRYISLPNTQNKQFKSIAILIPNVKTIAFNTLKCDYDVITGDYETIYITPQDGKEVKWRITKKADDKRDLLLKGLTVKWSYVKRKMKWVEDREQRVVKIMKKVQKWFEAEYEKSYLPANLIPVEFSYIVPAVSDVNGSILQDQQVRTEKVTRVPIGKEDEYEVTKPAVWLYRKYVIEDTPNGAKVVSQQLPEMDEDTFLTIVHEGSTPIYREMVTDAVVAKVSKVEKTPGMWKWVDEVAEERTEWVVTGGHWEEDI